LFKNLEFVISPEGWRLCKKYGTEVVVKISTLRYEKQEGIKDVLY